jgi:hypothetical protein
MRNMRRMQLQAGRGSSIARGNSPNEPTVESVKNTTNRLAEYVCAAESARVGRENEPTQLSEGRRIFRRVTFHETCPDRCTRASFGRAQSLEKMGPVPKNGTKKGCDTA